MWCVFSIIPDSLAFTTALKRRTTTGHSDYKCCFRDDVDGSATPTRTFQKLLNRLPALSLVHTEASFIII